MRWSASCRVRVAGLVEKIGEIFPGCVRCGTLDRECLAEIVLADREKLALLEGLVHPAVLEARKRFVASNPDAQVLVFEIPLLFETGGEKEFDKVVVVSAPVEIQRARVLERTGMSSGKLNSILLRQTPDEEKRRLADFVIETGGDLSTTESQVRRHSGLSRSQARADRFASCGKWFSILRQPASIRAAAIAWWRSAASR